MAHIVSRDLEILDEEEIKEGYDVLEGILAIVSAAVLTFIVQFLGGYIEFETD